MHLTRTGVERATFALSSNSSLTAPVWVAFVPEGHQPDDATGWTLAAWSDDSSVSGGTFHRTASVLVGGPDSSGAAAIVPAGESRAWVRVEASPERIERRAGLIVVG